MATVDKASVRAQLENHKVRFEALRQQGKLSPEAVIFIDSVMLLMELVIVILLEKTTTNCPGLLAADHDYRRTGDDLGIDGHDDDCLATLNERTGRDRRDERRPGERQDR